MTGFCQAHRRNLSTLLLGLERSPFSLNFLGLFSFLFFIFIFIFYFTLRRCPLRRFSSIRTSPPVSAITAWVTSSNEALMSLWTFFHCLDGNNQKKPSPLLPPSPPVAVPLLPYGKNLAFSASVATAVVALPQRQAAVEGFFRGSYLLMVAATATTEVEEEKYSEVESGDGGRDEDVGEGDCEVWGGV